MSYVPTYLHTQTVFPSIGTDPRGGGYGHDGYVLVDILCDYSFLPLCLFFSERVLVGWLICLFAPSLSLSRSLLKSIFWGIIFIFIFPSSPSPILPLTYAQYIHTYVPVIPPLPPPFPLEYPFTHLRPPIPYNLFKTPPPFTGPKVI